MNTLAEQIIVNIIKQEMLLANSRVWIRDENLLIPPDKDIFVIVGLMNATPMSNTTYMETRGEGEESVQWEVSQYQQREDIQIDILSRSTAAKIRKWEIVAALQSFYAQQQQELNNFKIFRIPSSFVNASGAEGGSNINRYSITVACFVWYKKEKLLKSPLGDYYDDFNTRVDDEETIGTDTPLFEFEITPETPTPP